MAYVPRSRQSIPTRYDQVNLDLVWSDVHGYTREVQRALASDLAFVDDESNRRERRDQKEQPL